MGRHLPRRAFLRGLGVAVGLPLLDAMTPAFASPAARATPTRLAFIYAPTGSVMKHWTPAMAGPDYEFTRILKPLEPYRKDLLVVSGLAHHNGESLGDGGGDHGRASASYLTGVHPKETEGAELKCAVSPSTKSRRRTSERTRDWLRSNLDVKMGGKSGIATLVIAAPIRTT